MAHAFDTSLARPQRTLIRNGVVSLLGGLLRSNGGYLAAVLTWGGVVRGYTDVDGVDEIKKRLNGRAPAIVVACGDRKNSPAGMGGRSWKSDLQVSLYHYSNHQSSMTEGRTSTDPAALASDVKDPGLDVMLEHAEELVAGQFVGGPLVVNAVGERSTRSITIKRMLLTDEDELLTDATHTLWVQRYSVEIDRTINKYRDVVQLLEEIRTIVRPSAIADATVLTGDGVADRVLEIQNEPTTP